MGRSKEWRFPQARRLRRAFSLLLLWGVTSIAGIGLILTQTPLVNWAAQRLVI